MQLLFEVIAYIANTARLLLFKLLYRLILVWSVLKYTVSISNKKNKNTIVNTKTFMLLSC